MLGNVIRECYDHSSDTRAWSVKCLWIRRDTPGSGMPFSAARYFCGRFCVVFVMMTAHLLVVNLPGQRCLSWKAGIRLD